MESKPKKRQVRKAVKATPERKEQPKQQDKPSQAEALVKFNGDLVESLIAHEGWHIVEELIDEGIASVSGRKTNGYYYDGELTRGGKNKDYLSGYQEALSQLYNRVKDFILARDKMIKRKKDEEAMLKGEVYNPFLEEDNV
jgi:hypothetical protein